MNREKGMESTKSGMSRRQALAGIGSLGAAGMLVVTGAGLARAAGGDGPIRVGMLGPFTGPASRTGEEIRNGALMALEDARAAGDLPVAIGGTKRDIEYVWIDDQSDPEKAVKAFNYAIDRDHIDILWGGWHSSVAMAVMDVAAARHIIGFGIGGNATSVNDKINKDYQKYRGWTKNWPASEMEATLYAPPLKYFLEQGVWKPATKKTAVLVEDTDFGRGWGKAVTSSFKAAGLEVLPFDAFPMQTTDFTPLIIKYKAQKVSLVGLTGTAAVSVANFLKQAHDQKLGAVIACHGISWSSDWYKLTGEASNYVLAADTALPLTPEAKKWVERYKAKFGQEPSIAAAGDQYDVCRIGVDVLRQAGSLDFDKLVATIQAVDAKGLFQRWRWSKAAGPDAMSANDVVVGDFMKGFFMPMAQLFNGERKVVWPLEFADQKFQQPPGT